MIRAHTLMISYEK